MKIKSYFFWIISWGGLAASTAVRVGVMIYKKIPGTQQLLHIATAPVLCLGFAVMTCLLVFISVLGSYILFIVLQRNKYLGKEPPSRTNVKGILYEIYIWLYSVYNLVLIALILMLDFNVSSTQRNVMSIVLALGIATAMLFKLNRSGISQRQLRLFTFCVFIVNGITPILGLIV